MFQWLCKNIVLKSIYLKAGCKISEGTAGFWYQEAVVLRGGGEHEDRELHLLVSENKILSVIEQPN